MSRRNPKTICRQVLQTSVAVILLCGFALAQKGEQPVSEEDYFKRGLAKMKAAESLKPTNAALKKYEEAAEDFDLAIELNPEEAAFYLNRGECFYKTSFI